MRSSAFAWLLVICALGTTPAFAATDARTLAVTFFDNNSNDPDFDPLGRGLAAMLITDLSNVQGLKLVERTRINEVMSEIELQKSPWIDPSTAAEMGRGLGAQYVLTGAFVAVKPTMRIDARVVSVQNGAVLYSTQVTGPVDEFFLLEKELAGSIVEGLKVDVSARENARMGRVATESFDAFLTWSRGLDALDRGRIEEARASLQASLEHDERFALATDALDALSKRIDALRGKREEVVSERTARILKHIHALANAGGPYDTLQKELLQVQSLSYFQDASDLYSLGSKLMDLKLPEELRLGGPEGWISINEWAMAQYVLSCQALGRRVEFLTYGESFLQRYPASPFHLLVSTMMNQMLGQMKKEEAGRGEVAKVRVEAMGAALAQKCRMERDPVVQFEACRAWVEDARAAGVEVHEDAEEAWAKSAARRGLVDEIERLHRTALAVDRYGEPAEEVGDVLATARNDAADAEKSLERLADALEKGKERVADYMRAVGDSVDAGRFQEAIELIEAAVERWPGESLPYRAAVQHHLNYGKPKLAQAWLERWEAAAEHGAKVNATLARQVRNYEEDTRYVRDADALGLLTLGQKLNEAAQYRESADAYLRLAREHPTAMYMTPATALYMAGNGYRIAGMNSEAREAWEEALRLYPEADICDAVRSMLDTIPK